MARQIDRLNPKSVEKEKRLGRHSDGGGLYLLVAAREPTEKDPSTVTRRWVFIYRSGGKLRYMGLGPSGKGGVPLAEARDLAETCRSQIRQGLDPIDARKAERQQGGTTFRDVAQAHHAARQDGWKNAKVRKQWLVHMEAYCKPIWLRPVDEITASDVVAILKPIWNTKAETASRLRGRIEAVLDAARVSGFTPEDRANPARWKGHLELILGKRQKLQRGHHKAMPFADVAAYVASLRARPGIDARCLEFTILTAARSGEALGARWDEIDAKAKVWVVPKERMKASVEHRVPLSDRALAIVAEMELLRTDDNPFVFRGRKPGKPLSVMALEMCMRRMKAAFTVHGFRSTFRDWCGEATSHPREVAEQALAHAVGNAVERSYRRGDALEKRRIVMQDWAKFIDGKTAAAPTDLAAERARRQAG